MTQISNGAGKQCVSSDGLNGYDKSFTLDVACCRAKSLSNGKSLDGSTQTHTMFGIYKDYSPESLHRRLKRMGIDIDPLHSEFESQAQRLSDTCGEGR